MANPRPTKFLWPKLESRSSDFSILWDSSDFCYFAAQKVYIFGKFFKLRLTDQFGLATQVNHILTNDIKLFKKNDLHIVILNNFIPFHIITIWNDSIMIWQKITWAPLFNMMSRDESLRIKNNYSIRFIWIYFYYNFVLHFN